MTTVTLPAVEQRILDLVATHGETLPVAAAASLLKVDRVTLRRFVRDGDIPGAFVNGTNYVIPTAAFAMWLHGLRLEQVAAQPGIPFVARRSA